MCKGNFGEFIIQIEIYGKSNDFGNGADDGDDQTKLCIRAFADKKCRKSVARIRSTTKQRLHRTDA